MFTCQVKIRSRRERIVANPNKGACYVNVNYFIS